MNLVILESPFKVGTIKSFLGSNYKVIASKGHVRDLPKSSMGVDIEHDFEPHYISIRGKGDLILEIRKEAKAASKIFLATDPDREGESISWHLAETIGIPLEKTQRVTFNEITKTAVKTAIKSPRNIDMNLVNAQQARRILDRVVGYKLSPILWKNVKSGLSAGRVQSVATKIIVDREREIRAFVPEEYWTIDVVLDKGEKPFTVRFFGNKDGKLVPAGEKEVREIISKLEKGKYTVRSIHPAVKHKLPAPPFTTSTMQQEASRRLGFQSRKIMRVAQELYEGINLGSENGGVQGLITYMRTDSLRISSEAQEKAKAFITEKYGEKYYPSTPRHYKAKAGAQDAHEAIRPSRIELEPAKIRHYLSNDQYRLYKLIWDRFVASQMESAELETLSVEVENSGYLFHTGGYKVIFPGYKAIYEELAEESSAADEDMMDKKDIKLPALSKGEVIDAREVIPAKHFTEPLPRYNEATLIKCLEEKGIGRPSTYTPIITTILERNYVRRDGKNLVPTPLGEVTTKLMEENFQDVVNIQFTADMETKLDEIEKGMTTTSAVLNAFWKDCGEELEKAENKIDHAAIDVPAEETDIVCEKCGSRMIIKNGRFGRFAACPNYPRCKNTKPLDTAASATTEKTPKKIVLADFKCEKCGSDVVIRSGPFGNFYACSRYPQCDFTKAKNREFGVNCPKCGSKIIIKHGRSKTVFYSCERYPACDFSTWDMPTNEICPKCGGMLFHKKGKSQLICANKSCGYTCDYVPKESADPAGDEKD